MLTLLVAVLVVSGYCTVGGAVYEALDGDSDADIYAVAVLWPVALVAVVVKNAITLPAVAGRKVLRAARAARERKRLPEARVVR